MIESPLGERGHVVDPIELASRAVDGCERDESAQEGTAALAAVAPSWSTCRSCVRPDSDRVHDRVMVGSWPTAAATIPASSIGDAALVSTSRSYSTP